MLGLLKKLFIERTEEAHQQCIGALFTTIRLPAVIVPLFWRPHNAAHPHTNCSYTVANLELVHGDLTVLLSTGENHLLAPLIIVDCIRKSLGL